MSQSFLVKHYARLSVVQIREKVTEKNIFILHRIRDEEWNKFYFLFPLSSSSHFFMFCFRAKNCSHWEFYILFYFQSRLMKWTETSWKNTSRINSWCFFAFFLFHAFFSKGSVKSKVYQSLSSWILLVIFSGTDLSWQWQHNFEVLRKISLWIIFNVRSFVINVEQSYLISFLPWWFSIFILANWVKNFFMEPKLPQLS